ncbi:MAG: hypothetical protein EAX86_07185 [Candidatus Heimdallarchaeota archaeon]|nr:hypothetical protein [Candidatus Heimdallarchaeota archaeon]
MSSETEGLLVSKEVLLKIRDLATELRSLDPTVQVVPSLNEAQRLMGEIEKLQNDIPSAGFLKKRGLKRNYQQYMEKYNQLNESLLNTLLVGYRKIYFDLANNIKEIAKFIPQETETIKKLQIPSFDPSQIVKFSASVLKTYNEISEVLRGKNLSVLAFNREVIELYEKFVDFDEEKIRITSQTTKTSIHVLSISDLLNLYDQLEAENAYLKQRRKGTKGKIQVAIVQLSSEILQHLDTISSIGLDLGDKPQALKQQIKDIQSEADNAKSVENLLEIEKTLNNHANELINALRTYEIALKTETDDQIGRIMQIIGKESSESNLKPAPEIDVSSSSIPSIIQDIEKVRSWHQQQIIAVKKIITPAELINAGKTINAMKIPLPEGFVDLIRQIEKDAEKITDLQDWVHIIKQYYDIKSQLSEECQNYFFRLLENPYIQEVINVSDGPQVPTVRDFETLSPSELVNKVREIKDWETRLIAYFSKPAQMAMRQNLFNLYDSRESLRGILSEELTKRIQEQKNRKEVEDKEIRELVKEIEVLNRLNADIKIEIWTSIDQEIHPIFNQFTNLETIPPKLKAHVPPLDLEDLKTIREDLNIAADDSIQSLLDEYEKIPVWKFKIISRVRDNLKNIPFPLLPIETEFDLREKRNQFISLIDKHAETGNVEAVIKEYITFLEAIEENKNEILVEIKKHIENLERVDKRLSRLLQSQTGSVKYPAEKELSNLDYSEALTEYWQLQAYIDRRISTIAEQMERELSSHIQDYSKLPLQYGHFFNDLVKLMEDKRKEIKTHKDITRLVNVFESYSLESLQMAKDCLAGLHQNLYSWLRVSLPRINEIIPLDPRVYAAEQKILNFQIDEISHERIANNLRQLIFLYDTEIVSELLAQAVQESRKVLKNVNDLKEVGINIISHVGGYIERFSQIIVKNQEDVEIKEITEVFVEIDNLQTDPNACNEIRKMGEQYIAEIQESIEYVFLNYQQDLRRDERVDLSYLNRFQTTATTNHIGHLTTAILEVAHVRSTIIQLMKTIEKDRNTTLQGSLGQLEYYTSIQEVFKRYIEEASSKIFPLSTLIELREDLMDSHNLRFILDLLPEIDTQREKWKDVSIQLNRWHRAIRMFRPRYTPTDNAEENIRQYKEISKKIKETYPHNEVIQAYLSLVMKLLIEIKSNTKLDV